MTQFGSGYILNEDDRQRVDETIRRVGVTNFKRNRNTNAPGAPPIRFGIVQTDWRLGDTTVSVLPARFDDFGSDLSLSEAINIYVMWHQYGRYIEELLEQDAVVPYIPFQGPDGNDVYGVIAGQLLIPDVNPFGFIYTRDGSDNPAVEINDGEVWYDKTSVVVASDDVSHALDTDKYFYVEITITAVENNDPTVTINPTIQTSGTEPTYWDESAGVTTINYPIAAIVSEVLYQQHLGELKFKTLYNPGFDTDYQGTVLNEGNFAGIKSATSSLAGKTYFLELGEMLMRYSAGELAEYTLDDEFKFGGTDQETCIDFLNDIDTETEDQIVFEYGALDYDVDSGLVQSILKDVATFGDIIISALGQWIGIEVGGQFYHKNSPVESTSDDDHWFCVTFTISGGISIDGGSAVNSITLYFDRTGHIWKYDITTQPPPDENYRYRHCTDPSTNPDLIFTSQQANTVIRIGDECYTEVGTTKAPATDPSPTVADTYSSCESCEADLTAEYWKRCDDDEDAAVLTDTHTDVEFAWLCISSAWVKCYYDRLTAETATDPTVLKQCNLGTPTSCNDLVGWPASDDFSGSGCNVGSIGDTNWTAKGMSTVLGTGVTAAITSERFVVTHATSTNSFQGGHLKLPISRDGDFYISADYITTMADTFRNNGYSYIWAIVGGTQYGCGMTCEGTVGTHSGDGRVYYNGSTWIPDGTPLVTSGTFEIYRTSGTLYFKVNGTQIATIANSGTLTEIWMRHSSFSNGGANYSSFDNFTVLDGVGGDDLIIDPTGASCT